MNWEVRTMRSVTSCFNSTLYRKNLSRFWPIWALYSVIWLFALPLNLLTTIQRGQNWALEDLTHSLDYFSRVSVSYSLNLGTVLAVIFGLLAAMAVFSYLDASRSACMMHALPLRREALFFTNYLSGLSFLLLPNAAIFGLTLAGEAVGNCLDLKALAIWLLVQSASCLFFYSFAVFCAMFTGHLLALPVFYGVLNCLAAIISTLMDSVLYLFLYGYNGLSGTTQQAVAWLTPLEKLGGAVSWTQAADSGAYQLAQPAVVAVYAGVGVALSAAALLIYRARQMESAGDVVSVRVVRPIFKYGVAVCAGLSGGTFTYYVLFGDGQLSLVLSILFWAAVGYFLAEMLLRKSFRVFSAWPGCLVLLALLSALFLCIRLDLTGYQDYVPASGEVSQVTVDLEGSTYPSDGFGGSVQITDPEQVAQITALHQAIVAARSREDSIYDDSFYISLSYTLSNGQSIRRYYHGVPLYRAEQGMEGTVTWALDQLVSDRSFVRAGYGLDQSADWSLTEAYVYDLWDIQTQSHESASLSAAQAEQLWQAVLTDFDAGTIGTRYLFEDQDRRENTCEADLDFSFYLTEQDSMVHRGGSVTITLTPQASHTLAVLEELGVLTDTRIARTHAQVDRWYAMTDGAEDTSSLYTASP